MKEKISNLLKQKKGIFGLTAVQQFFVIILGLGLLAYVIVVIMGTLSGSSILPLASSSAVNESGSFNGPYTFATATTGGFTAPAITQVLNQTGGFVIAPGNYTIVGNTVTNATARIWTSVLITYNYNLFSAAQTNTNTILLNTSGGIASFFSSINPVYAILAVLVIILVLIVLVRVVSGGGGMGGKETAPQL